MNGKQSLVVFAGVGLIAFRFFTSSQKTQVMGVVSGGQATKSGQSGTHTFTGGGLNIPSNFPLGGRII